ncbi:lrr receptor-like serine threonine-protein kinase [Hordeum vulgare]|nr:lrr receptor-like serine threonine-protein kinase [Hordeum vulgare]
MWWCCRVDVGGVHDGAGKLATAADVAGSASSLQKVKASSGAINPDALVAPPSVEEQEDDGWGGVRKRKLADYDPYEGAFSDDSEYEYDSGDDVYKGNFASFTTKEVQKIKANGVASFCRKFKKWHCPYHTFKPKPKDGRLDHLLSHAEDVAIREEDYKIRGQHAALAKALTPA